MFDAAMRKRGYRSDMVTLLWTATRDTNRKQLTVYLNEVSVLPVYDDVDLTLIGLLPDDPALIGRLDDRLTIVNAHRSETHMESGTTDHVISTILCSSGHCKAGD